MLTLLIAFAVQPASDLYSKLDILFENEVAELKASIERSEKRKSASKSNATTPSLLSAIAEKKTKLSNLVKNYSITIPIFDFNKGVREGDIGTIGYYYESGSRQLPNGSGGTIRVHTETKVVQRAKVRKIEGNKVHLRLLGKGGSVVVTGLDVSSLTDEQIISLNKHIYRYDGKGDSNVKQYTIVGDQNDYESWRKLRMNSRK